LPNDSTFCFSRFHPDILPRFFNPFPRHHRAIYVRKIAYPPLAIAIHSIPPQAERFFFDLFLLHKTVSSSTAVLLHMNEFFIPILPFLHPTEPSRASERRRRRRQHHPFCFITIPFYFLGKFFFLFDHVSYQNRLGREPRACLSLSLAEVARTLMGGGKEKEQSTCETTTTLCDFIAQFI
jgi:hypothetical protein